MLVKQHLPNMTMTILEQPQHWLVTASQQTACTTDTRTNLTTQDECTRAHNGHTTPGSVTLSSTTILNDQHKDLIMSQSRSVSQQPPTPLTAQQVHRDQPPDEHPDGAKRVAGVGLWSHVSSPHFPVPPTTTTDSVTNNVTGESSNTATLTNNATDSSSIQRSRRELWSVPPNTRPVPPEEDMSTPAHPLVKLTKALNYIDNQAQNMYVKLKQILNKIHKLYTSNTTAQNNVLNSIHWQNVKFYLPEADQHELHQIIHTVSAPLLNCIQEHCKESMCTLYHNVITTINNTYHVIRTDDMSCHIAEHTTESKIHESIHKLLKHLKENENNVNQHTITQQTHTYNSTMSLNPNNAQQINKQTQIHTTIQCHSTLTIHNNTIINTHNNPMSLNPNNAQQINKQTQIHITIQCHPTLTQYITHQSKHSNKTNRPSLNNEKKRRKNQDTQSHPTTTVHTHTKKLTYKSNLQLICQTRPVTRSTCGASKMNMHLPIKNKNIHTRSQPIPNRTQQSDTWNNKQS